MDPIFSNKNALRRTEIKLPLIVMWRWLYNSVLHLNLLHFELLSRESETEHHATGNMDGQLVGPCNLRASLVIRKFTRHVSFKCQLTLLGDTR